MGKKRFELYHGTDYDVALKIQKEGFVVKPNKEHWLGNGIYFYIDKSLAKWWTTNPTAKHGVRIKTPATIKVLLSVSNDRVLDLREKSDFDKLIGWEKEYRTEFLKHANEETVSAYKYRCGLFDDVFDRREIDVIIGGFSSSDQPYVDIEMLELLNKLKITYTEVQVCVKTDKQKELLSFIEINKGTEKFEE